MKRILIVFLVLLIPILSEAQTISFSPQATAILKTSTGRSIKGVELVDVILCTVSPLTISNGIIYQKAVQSGFSTLSPSMGTVLVNQTVRFNWTNFVINFITDASIGVATLGAAKVIKMSTQALTSLVVVSGVWNAFSPQLRNLGPNATPLLSSLLDPSKTTYMSQSSCIEGTLLTEVTKIKSIGPIAIP